MGSVEKTLLEQPLDEGNWTGWDFRLRAVLRYKGIEAVLREEGGDEAAADAAGGEPNAGAGIGAAAAAADAERAPPTQRVLALIQLSISPHLQPTIADATTAKQAYEQLRDVYAARSAARRIQLRQALLRAKMGAGESVAKFISRVRVMRAELIAAGDTVTDAEVATAVVIGLPHQYSMVTTVLQLSEATDWHNLDTLLAKLVEERCFALCCVYYLALWFVESWEKWLSIYRFGKQVLRERSWEYSFS